MNVEETVEHIASWTVPVNILIWLAGKEYETQQFRRSWLPPQIANLRDRIVKGDKECQKS